MLSFGAQTETSQPSAQLIASPEPGWPQWRGPRRDGICDETGLLQSWPEGGPRLLWKATGLGRGFSSPIITGGRIFLTGDGDDALRVFALDMQGRQLWESSNGKSWTGPYPGARACCAYSEGRVYLMNAHGRTACFDASNGKELWSVDVLQRFGGKPLTWGIADCLLVDGPRVIVTPGGTNALMAALDKKNGQTVWTTEPLRLVKTDDPAQERLIDPAEPVDSTGYSSPILFALGGRRHLVRASLRHVFGVDADAGKLLWTRPMRTSYSVIAATPVLVGAAVFMTAPDTEGGKLFQIEDQGSSVRVETLWTTPLDTCHGCLVYRDGDLYGSWYRRSKGWACLDAGTGTIRYQTKELGMGSVLYADQRLYCLGQEGDMTLIQATPQGFVFTGRFRLTPERTTEAWAHPVILDGRLYLRYHDTLFCYDVKSSKAAPSK
jgi:outer membrane protein assembly factor BamB